MIMRIILMVASSFLMARSLHAAIPVVTNVFATQMVANISGVLTTTKMVRITYDVFDEDNDPLRIRIEVSSDGGVDYSVPAFTFTNFPALGYTNQSDIGENIMPGTNKVIIWDAEKDWDGEYSTQMVVKVFAIDNIGFPGLEWGNEVPPSGFLMGQDGGAEGSGPSRHVNIPWSYWLGKYEVRADQYCDFLNMALVANDVYRLENEVYANAFRFPGVPGDALLIQLGDGLDIRWNVNNFEVNGSLSNFPVRVTWFGAMAFAQYYGYDLPTEAEWEKASRGPDHDDEDEHLLYHWGDVINPSDANYWFNGDPYDAFGPSKVGYFNGEQIPFGVDRVNAYNLYDMAGNVIEWTRSLWCTCGTIEDYPEQESMISERNNISVYAERVLRGGSFDHDPFAEDSRDEDVDTLSNYRRDFALPDDMVFGRLPPLSYESKPTAGFRVARRDLDYRDLIITNTQTISFPQIPTQIITNTFELVATASSGLPVTFTLVQGPAVISGTQISFTGVAGFFDPVVVVASQPGNTNFLAAPSVTNKFEVIRATASIVFSNLTQFYDGTPKAVSASSIPPGLPVNITYDDDPQPPTDPGVYSVVGVINTDLFSGSASNTFTIEFPPVLTETFDGSEWTYNVNNNWTLNASSGTWSGQSGAYRMTNSAFAFSPNGSIQFSGSTGRLTLPLLSEPAGRIILWARRNSASAYGPIQVVNIDGTPGALLEQTPSGTTYERLIFDVSERNATQFYIESYSTYVDDIEVFPQ